MGWFGKKDKVVDWSEKYKEELERAAMLKEDRKSLGAQVVQTNPASNPSEKTSISSDNPTTILSNIMSRAAAKKSNPRPKEESEELIDVSPSLDEKKRMVLKKLTDLTTRLENISMKIYKIEQRLDLIERKMNLGHH